MQTRGQKSESGYMLAIFRKVWLVADILIASN